MLPLPQQILELAYWLPLVALVLVSLGLVALKWMPSLPLWAERLKSYPFYLITLHRLREERYLGKIQHCCIQRLSRFRQRHPPGPMRCCCCSSRNSYPE